MTELEIRNPERTDREKSSKGSKGSTIKDENDNFDWPYTISIDLRKSPKPKIAFLSCEERKYYPESPGHTRMGVEFAMNYAPGGVPNPNYYPPTLGVNKPISLLGYGIGGLLASRFLKDDKATTPDAGMYQKIIDRKVPGIVHPYSPSDPILRRQCKVGFGRNNTLSRFGIEKAEQPPPGPGTYDVNSKKCSSIKRTEAFGGPRHVIPTVMTVCMVDGGERCCECGQVQLADYYRSTKLRHPEKKRASILAMCRKCYCKAWNGNFQYWTNGRQGGSLQGSPFESLRKARHCNFIHDHKKLSQFIHKTTCKEVKRLTMKEVILNKYYKDCCPPEHTFGKNK